MNAYDSWHHAHAGEDDREAVWHSFARRQLQTMSLSGKMILEIGCGRGGFSQSLARQFPDIDRLFACDYSESALAIAKSSSGGADKVVWQKEDVQKMSFPDSAFDVIVSCETIEHVPQPGRALGEMSRVLKPGGKLILTCPNYFNLFGIWCLYRKLIGKPYTEGGQPYVNYIQLPSTYTRIKSLGFRIDHFHSSEFIIPARVPKTLYSEGTPRWLSYLGSRTFYALTKR